MAYSRNVAFVQGFLGKDAKKKDTKNGVSVSFSVATSRSYKKGDQWEDETTWHNVVLYSKESPSILPYLEKGREVSVQGRISNRSYTDADNVERLWSEIVAFPGDVIIGSTTEERKARNGKPKAAIPPPDEEAPF